jgi:DNA-binding beta-propeller fold protein YncE
MRRLHVIFILVLASLAGCASGGGGNRAAGESAAVQFPPYPAEPVIEWVAAYSTVSDVGGGQSKWQRAITGEVEREPGLLAPTAVALGPHNEMYVADQELDGVVIIDPQSKRFDLFRGDGQGQLRKPVGVAVADDGSLYVSDTTARAVYVYDAELRFRASFGGPRLFTQPTGLALSSDGQRLAVCDTAAHTVFVFDARRGEMLTTLGGEAKSGRDGEFHTPYAVAYDEEGYLYVSDYLNFRIQVFDPAGDLELVFGQIGDRPGDLNRPRGLAVDATAGVIFEVDGAFQLVQMFNLDGEILMWFGGPGTGPGGFDLPSGIARRGNLLAVADTLNSRVQLFRFLGPPTGTETAGE